MMNGKNKNPRIICVGSNIESQISLKALVDANVNIVALVTRPAGNAGSVSDYVDLHDFCQTFNIKIIDTLDINSKLTLLEIKNEKPDYIFTLGWSQLFKSELLSIPSEFIIGSHPSILPNGKGRAPVPWTILEDLRESAVSFFKMDLGADTGEIIHREYFKIPMSSYALDVYKLVANSLAKGFIRLLFQILNNDIKVLEKIEISESFRGKRGFEDGLINFDKSASDIDKLIRAVSFPYPGAYTYYNDKIVKVWKCSLECVPTYSASPGQIIEVKTDKLLVYSESSAIWLSSITNQFGNPLDPKTFKLGSKFGYRVQDEIYQLKIELEKLKKKLENE